MPAASGPSQGVSLCSAQAPAALWAPHPGPVWSGCWPCTMPSPPSPHCCFQSGLRSTSSLELIGSLDVHLFSPARLWAPCRQALSTMMLTITALMWPSITVTLGDWAHLLDQPELHDLRNFSSVMSTSLCHYSSWQMQKLKPWEGEELVQGHPARKWQSKNFWPYISVWLQSLCFSTPCILFVTVGCLIQTSLSVIHCDILGVLLSQW